MPDVLIRGVSEADLAKIDAAAERLGLSRNGFLLREVSRIAAHRTGREVTREDFRRMAQQLDLSVFGVESDD